MNRPTRCLPRQTLVTTACAMTLAAGALALCVAPPAARAGDLALRPTQSPNVTPPEKTPESQPQTQSLETPADSIDWDAVLNYDPATLSSSRTYSAPAGGSNWSWDQNHKTDGTSTVTVKRALPTEWDSKVGVDMNAATQQSSFGRPVDPAKLLPGGSSSDTSDGAAWATITAPALNAPVGWDKATIDARFDPQNEERKFGATISKSVPFSDTFSMTLQNGYAMTQSQTTVTPITTVPGTLAAAHSYGTHNVTTENMAKFNLLPTGTSFSVGTALSTDDEKWRRSVGAEQKLFGGISVKGSVSETASGVPDKSLSAGFKRTW